MDLTTQRVPVSTQLTIKNDAKSKVADVTICLPEAQYNHASILQVGQVYKETDKIPENMIAKGPWSPPTNGPQGVVCADYTLSSPLAKGDTATIMVGVALTKVLRPRPAEIHQGDPQRMLFSDYANVISPYKILSDSTTVKVGSKKPESFRAPSPSGWDGKALTLGPYTNVAPFTVSSLTVHYQNNHPTLEASSVVREISISHWGNVYFEEKYVMHHNGAKIVGEWSRLDLVAEKSKSLGAAEQFPAVIPPSSYWIYFRDDIGNISTSTLKPSKQGLNVVLSPRFPLFGGWQTKFLFGYSVPLGDTVGFNKKTGKYVLTTSVLPAVKNTVFDELEVRVVLPEGASAFNVELMLPYEQSQEKQYTYFDVLGRNVIVLRMKNLVPESPGALQVSYSYATTSLLLKPLVLSGGIAALFVAFVLLLGSSSTPKAKLKTV